MPIVILWHSLVALVLREAAKSFDSKIQVDNAIIEKKLKIEKIEKKFKNFRRLI